MLTDQKQFSRGLATSNRCLSFGALLALAALLVAPANVPAQSGTWISTLTGLWNVPGNWSGGAVANGPGNTANFSTIDLTADLTNHLDSAITIGKLFFGDTVTNTPAGWVVDDNGSPANSLTLSGTTPSITVNPLGPGKSVTMGAGLVLTATGVRITNTAGGTLSLSGSVTTPVASGDLNLTKYGSGVMNVTGGTLFTSGSSPNRILNIVQGTVNFSNATVHLSSLITPTSDNVYITATNSIFDIDDAGWYHGGLRVGWGNGFASCSINGVSVTLNPNAEIVRIAGNGNTGRAILSLDGGAALSTGGIDMGETDYTFGELNLRNATVTNTWEFRIGISKGIGLVNQLGENSLVNNTAPVIFQYRMNQQNCWGIYNLSGGTLKTASIKSGDGNSGFTGNRSFLNFHGGTLSPQGNSANFVFSTLTGANAGSVSAPQLLVYSEGAVIDTDGRNITINEKLQAPPGQGVSETTILLPAANQGWGYKGEPLLRPELTPGGLVNVTATAVANMVDDGSGNGTFKIASIRITNPGLNYTVAPTLNAYGGDPVTNAVLPVLTIAPNVSGGLTKRGPGTLTLAGASTYIGLTRIEAGVLAATNPDSLGATNSLNISAGGKLDVTGGVTVTAHSLTLDGVGQRSGTYGATGSGANFIDDTHFSGTGLVNALTGALRPLRITGVSYDANNDRLTLKWDSAPGALYTLENSQVFVGNGAGTSWDNLTTGIPSGGPTTTVVVDAPLPGTYFRIRKE